MDATIPALVRRVFGVGGEADNVLFVRTPRALAETAKRSANEAVVGWLHDAAQGLGSERTLVVETRDVRTGAALCPMGLEVCRALRRMPPWKLKEIIAVVPEEAPKSPAPATDSLAICQRYLVVAIRNTPNR